MKKNEIAMLVMSCDAYEDVADHFFELKKRFMPWWDYNCYFINDSNNYKKDNVITINGGKNKNWSGRLKNALKKIPEKYILYMQEDYLIDKAVLKDDIEKAIKYIKKNKIWYYKIDNLPKIRKMIDDIHSTIPSNVRYGINLLTAIIDKEKFIELLPEKDSSAWEVESSFLNNVTNDFEYDIEGCVLNTKPIISVCYGVRHGKWMNSVIKHFKKIDYFIEPKNRKVMGKYENSKLYIMDFISHKLTTKQLRRLKKVLLKFNFKFISKDK